MLRSRGSLCLARVALHSFPRRFRKMYEAEMLAALEERWRTEPGASRWSDLVGLVRAGLAERMRPALRPTPMPSQEAAGGGASLLDSLSQDVRQAWRALRRRPLLTLAAVGTLALGIGANTVIFSVVYGVLWRSLPFPEPERLVSISRAEPHRDLYRASMSQPDLIDLEREVAALERVVGFNTRSFTVVGEEGAEAIRGATVTGGLVEAMGGPVTWGRDLRSEEAGPAAARTVVVSHGFFESRLGGDPAVLGTTLTLSDRPYQIVGVAPPGFDFPQQSQLWTPTDNDVEDCGRGCHFFRVVGLLAEGTTVREAQAGAALLAGQLRDSYPEESFGKEFEVEPLRRGMVREVELALLMLQLAVLFVLLIAASNVANLRLVEGEERRDELAMRAALGASGGRLLRLLLSESLMLGGAGGILGVALSFLGTRLFLSLAPSSLPRLDSVRVDGAVLGFAWLLVLAVVVIAGLLPGFRLASISARRGLVVRRAGRELKSARSRTLLLVVEVALSFVLLLAAGLLLRSFQRLAQVPLGFAPAGVATFFLALPEARYDTPEKIVAFYGELESRLRAMPGVESAGAILGVPLGRNNINTSLRFLDRPDPPPGQEENADLRVVTHGYLETLGIPLVAGRRLSASDRSDGAPVVMVNRAFARRYFPSGEVLGARLELGLDFGLTYESFEVVGVAENVRSALAIEPLPEVYVPQSQMAVPWMTVLVRSGAGAPASLAALAREVAELDVGLPLHSAEPMTAFVDRARGPALFYLALVASFAVTALLLAAVGLYGVIAYVVSRRQREIAIRMAIGADRKGIQLMVLRQGALPIGLGLLLGLVLASWLGRFLATLLYATTPSDGPVAATVVLVLVGVSLLALALPARRASAVAPAEALGAE